MNDRPPRKSLFERLEKGLMEAIDHAQGKLKLRETQLEVFSPPRKLGSSDIQELREKLSLSQANLANPYVRFCEHCAQLGTRPKETIRDSFATP